MILPSSHSPGEIRDHAMRAALRDPQRGRMPMVQDANCRLNVSRDPGRQGQIGSYVRRNDPGSRHALTLYLSSMRFGSRFYIDPIRFLMMDQSRESVYPDSKRGDTKCRSNLM